MYQETKAQGKNPKPNTTVTTITKLPSSKIDFTLSMSKPWTHLLEVEMRVSSAQMPEQTELKMPAWTPGSYLIREYARHVQDFSAADKAGKTLAWRKINKNTWQVDTKGTTEFVARYTVYANELTVRTSELNDEHAFISPASVFMFPKDEISSSSTVKVNPYGNWKVATGLPQAAGKTNTFQAENFDILYDSPFEISDFNEITFDVSGKKHRYVFTGEGNYDPQKIARDTAKIVTESSKIFGDLPYEHYLFIVNLRGGGGLEHINSTALQWNKFGFKPEARYKDFLNLVAHEYFHLWNVKRIRPDALGPFDYENENYTKLLWVAEGGTSYYEGVLLRRAGIISAQEFLDGKSKMIQQLQERPGRFETSAEDASFDAWIKYYRQDENSINNQISYYDKGDILNFLLDVEIRASSGGAKSLDDVFRYLYDEFAKKGKNYSPEDFQKISEQMAGKSLKSFFDKYVRGTEEIDYNSILNGIGLKLETKRANAREEVYLGANMAEADGKLTVRSIPAGSPAYQYGLNTGDQIVAVDGYRAGQTFIQNYMKEKKPGDKVKLTIFRFDELREITVTLGGQFQPNYRIVAVENPSARQKKLYKDYLGEELE